MSPETKSQISTIPAKETPKRNEQIGTPKSPEERKSEANIRKNEAWQDLQKIPTQVAENVIKLFGKISGKVPQITTSQIPQKIGSNEIKSTTDFGKVEISNPQVEVKEVEEILIQPLIPLREPTPEELSLIRLKRQKIIGKTSEVSGYLNKKNLGGRRKKEPEEKIGRNAVSSWIRYSRNLERSQEIAELKNPELENKIFELEKENSDLRCTLRELEMLTLQMQYHTKNPLIKLFNSKKIQEAEFKIDKIINKKGGLGQIQLEIKQNKAHLELLKKKYYENKHILVQENPNPRNPKEILEKYYEQKLVEFQAYQKQKLELINSRPVPIEEVVEKYNIFLMHGINELVGNTTTALYNNDFKTRLKTVMLNPALSSFSYGEGIKSTQMWSDCGVILGKNTNIFWASGSDLHTLSRSFRDRAPINRTHCKTIRNQIHSAIVDRSPNHNEFVVIGEPVGFWIAVTSQFQQWRGEYTMQYIRKTEPKILAAQKLGLPLFITMDGKIYKAQYIPVDKVIEKRRLEQKLPELETIGDYKACFILGKEVKPQDIMTMKSPITKEKQIEIAKELIKKGIFSKDQLPQEFFS